MKKKERFGLYICAITGLILLSIGINQYSMIKDLKANGIEVLGEVVELRAKGSSFSPVVEFIDHVGIKRLHYSNRYP